MIKCNKKIINILQLNKISIWKIKFLKALKNLLLKIFYYFKSVKIIAQILSWTLNYLLIKKIINDRLLFCNKFIKYLFIIKTL